MLSHISPFSTINYKFGERKAGRWAQQERKREKKQKSVFLVSIKATKDTHEGGKSTPPAVTVIRFLHVELGMSHSRYVFCIEHGASSPGQQTGSKLELFLVPIEALTSNNTKCQV